MDSKEKQDSPWQTGPYPQDGKVFTIDKTKAEIWCMIDGKLNHRGIIQGYWSNTERFESDPRNLYARPWRYILPGELGFEDAAAVREELEKAYSDTKIINLELEEVWKERDRLERELAEANRENKDLLIQRNKLSADLARAGGLRWVDKETAIAEGYDEKLHLRYGTPYSGVYLYCDNDGNPKAKDSNATHFALINLPGEPDANRQGLLDSSPAPIPPPEYKPEEVAFPRFRDAQDAEMAMRGWFQKIEEWIKEENLVPSMIPELRGMCDRHETAWRECQAFRRGKKK